MPAAGRPGLPVFRRFRTSDLDYGASLNRSRQYSDIRIVNRRFALAGVFGALCLLASTLFADQSAGRGSGALIGKLGGKRTVTVWAVGDGGDGGPPAVKVAKRIARDKPDLFLYLGDVYDNGTAQEYRKLYRPVYHRLDRIT